MFVFFVPFCKSSVLLNENYMRLLIFKFKFLKILEILILALTFDIKCIHLFFDGDFSAMKLVNGKIVPKINTRSSGIQVDFHQETANTWKNP